MGRPWCNMAGFALALAATGVVCALVERGEDEPEATRPVTGVPVSPDAESGARAAAAAGSVAVEAFPGEGTGLSRPRAPRAALAGVVLDPRGAPVAGAVVVARSGDEARETSTDVRGRFELEAPGPSGCQLRASDPHGRHGPVTVRDAPLDARALVLRLLAAPEVVLRVRGPDGAPLETFAAVVTVGGEVRAFHPLEPRPGGRLAVTVPLLPFHVEVRSDGCAPARLGPFDGTAPPAEVDVRLAPAPPDA